MRCFPILCCVLCLMCLMTAPVAQAHLASDTYLRIRVQPDQMTGQWDIALRDLDVAVGLDPEASGQITWGALRARRQAVETYAFHHLHITVPGGTCAFHPTGLMVDYHAGAAYAVFPFTIACPGTSGPAHLRYDLLFDIDPTHRGLLTVETGTTVSSAVLSPSSATLQLDTGTQSLAQETARFVFFGFDHILRGYDHLLFVAVLLITVALRRPPPQPSTRPAARPATRMSGRASGQPSGRTQADWVPIVSARHVMVDTIKTLTAFTTAHGLTLTLAVLGVITIPAQLTDPAIAVTIVLAAIDNIRPILPRLRWTVAFLFGLVHGLAFAAVVGAMHLPPLQLGLALGAFNIGVEAGQITLALLVVPTIFILGHAGFYRRIAVPALSTIAILLAILWQFDGQFGASLLALQPSFLTLGFLAVT